MARPLPWIVVILVGLGGLLAGRATSPAARTAPAPQDMGDALLGFSQTSGADVTSAVILAASVGLMLLGLLGLVRSLLAGDRDKAGTDPDPAVFEARSSSLLSAALGTADALPTRPAPLAPEPDDEDAVRRLVWPTIGPSAAPTAPEPPPVDPRAALLAAIPDAPPPAAPRPRPASATVRSLFVPQRPEPPPPTRDPEPTTPRLLDGPTDAPRPTPAGDEGFLSLFVGREAGSWFELLADLGRAHAAGSRLELSRLRRIDDSAELVSVFGAAGEVAAFLDVVRQFAGLEIASRGLDPAGTRPDHRIVPRAYAAAWDHPEPEVWRRLRDELAQGFWRTLASHTL